MVQNSIRAFQIILFEFSIESTRRHDRKNMYNNIKRETCYTLFQGKMMKVHDYRKERCLIKKINSIEGKIS